MATSEMLQEWSDSGLQVNWIIQGIQSSLRPGFKATKSQSHHSFFSMALITQLANWLSHTSFFQEEAMTSFAVLSLICDQLLDSGICPAQTPNQLKKPACGAG